MTATIQAGIQADDLTGACDTGAAFAAGGLETIVLLPDVSLPSAAPAIVVLDTESRGLPAAEARSRARAAAARLATLRPAVLYKKVDSTLRGPVAAELAGVLDGAGRSHAILTPAFPAQRRIVLDGLLEVDGRPAHETAVGRDPDFPATGASVPALLGVTGPHPVAHVPLATVRRGPAALAARLGRWSDTVGGVLVCDAETDDDLRRLVDAAVGGTVLLAGSAGLAAALAARLGGSDSAPRRQPKRPLCVVAGSAQPTTRTQVERLEARGIPATWLDGVGGQRPEGGTAGAGDRILAAQTPAGGDPTAERRRAMAERLAQATRQHLEAARRQATPVGTVLATGGDTAIALCHALGASGLRLAGEIERGLALGSLLDGPFAGLTVITKAGGFGDPDTLVRVWEGCA